MTLQLKDALSKFVTETEEAIDELGSNFGLALTSFRQAAKELRTAINEEPEHRERDRNL